MKAFLRFALLSGGGWVLDCCLLLALTRSGLPIGWANLLSSATAALAVFLISRIFVFRNRQPRVAVRAALYLVYQGFAILAASMAIGPLAGWVQAAVEASGRHVGAGMISILGKVLITPPQLIANYLVSRFLIEQFRRTVAHV